MMFDHYGGLLSCCAVLSVLLAVGGRVAAAEPPPEFATPPQRVTLAQIQTLPPHPRLMVNAAGWAALRERVEHDPAYREAFALLQRTADAVLTRPPVDYTPVHPGDNVLKAIRDAESRVLTLATVYRLTGRRAYLDGARGVLDGLAATPWTPSHFLDPATGCLVLGIGYDWLYDDLSPAERDRFAAKMRSEAIDRTMSAGQSFLWADFNWNQICNTGVTFGVLALAERDPGLAQHVVNRTIALVPRAAAAYAPDGIYPEGPGYWAYGTLYEAMLVDALRSCLGSGFGLERSPGFLASATAIEELTGPSGDVFGFADNRGPRKPESVVFWFARENRRPDVAAAEWARVLHGHPAGAGDPLPLALLWMPEPDRDPAKVVLPLNWQGGGESPVAVFRSAWNDPAATWLAIKGGTADHSHGHMDAGSFVFESAGVRWAIDPYIDDYLEVQNRSGMTHGDLFDYGQASRRWGVFRIGPDGHNIPRVDGGRQNVAGHATVGPIRGGGDGASVDVDLDSTYAGQLAAYRRTAGLDRDGRVTLEDRWTAADKPVELTWQWLTAAHATAEPGGVRLEQNGKTLHLRVSPAGAKIELQQVSTLLDAGLDSKDPGWTRVVVRVKTAARGQGQIRVVASPD